MGLEARIKTVKAHLASIAPPEDDYEPLTPAQQDKLEARLHVLWDEHETRVLEGLEAPIELEDWLHKLAADAHARRYIPKARP